MSPCLGFASEPLARGCAKSGELMRQGVDATRGVDCVGASGVDLLQLADLGVLRVFNGLFGLIFFNAVISQFFVFNGFFVSVANIPDYLIWLYYISPFSYTNGALYKIVFNDLTMTGCARLRGPTRRDDVVHPAVYKSINDYQSEESLRRIIITSGPKCAIEYDK
eukprot:1188942-Prorocentrum_minimum.AAC.2